MDLRQMFLFIVLLALFFMIGTIIGSFGTMKRERVPTLPKNINIPRREEVASQRHLIKDNAKVTGTRIKELGHLGDVDDNLKSDQNGIRVDEHEKGSNIQSLRVGKHDENHNQHEEPKKSSYKNVNVVTKSSAVPFDKNPDSRTSPSPKHASNGLEQELTQVDNVDSLPKQALNGQELTRISLDNIDLSNVENSADESRVKFHQDTYVLQEVNVTKYVKTFSPNVRCLIKGTNMIKTRIKKNKECVCHPEWQGLSCSVPQVVFKSNYPKEYGLVLIERPKRIIYAMPFSHEFDLLEGKLHELYDVVDVFLILESNWSAAGKPKECLLLNKLNSGYLSQFQDKIVYISLGYFPSGAYRDGWVADALLRDYIGTIGLKKILKNVREDDMIVVNDADELPTYQTMMFLKFHAGYPQPVGFKLRHNIFGFFWQGEGDYGTSEVYGAVSIGILQGLFKDSLYAIRSAPKRIPGAFDQERLMRNYGVRLVSWSFGTDLYPAGWHCSWCFNPEGVRMKLHHAHVSDEPRYGQIEGKDSLNYIQHIIKNGIWFDDKTKFKEVSEVYSDQYAPSYFAENWNKYIALLNLPL